jgi:superfamily II DNA or RNA helicase/HKD family nuclease/SOS-response transcriptional repressor LexA
MNKSFNENFKESLLTGFIDKTLESDALYQPELLVNRKIPRKKVLSTIINELENCESFFISVAFVTTGGVATLINTFKYLEEKGIKGKILVSQYLNFTQPEALKRLSQFKNIELKIITKENSHSKGYIFKHSEYYNLIIGSSNLTSSALSTNKEWNMKVSARNSSSIVEKVINEFQSDFYIGDIVNESYIKNYEEVYKKQFLVYKKSEEELSKELNLKIIPNSMQTEALENLKNLRKENNKALIISATGTGKTYLSAFDAKTFNPKKLLYVVHRLNIAKKAMKTFQTVFGNTKTMGLYSGKKRELNKDFIFSTVQTISRLNHLEQFSSDYFDYIIFDESHRSSADSYIRIINYFKPKFLLGMTATPDRTDGNDIYGLFDHNIAYEIRLNRAMEENMLIPFHYYGVTDLSVNGETLEKESDFRLLTANERVDKIIEKIEFYGSDNGITRGLIFCSKNDESKELSGKFNERGYKTIALSGDSSDEERAKTIERLESDNLEQKLDYIFTVDIFNEGIDIPKINQVIMVRPTQSAIIFIQQLGRGLRKTDGKHYLTVIDFIGNYKNNYLIPIALYGDTSYNKDSIRKLISEGSRMIPGESTINFDEITKEKIYASIDSAKMQLLTDLKKDYNNLKSKIGRIPMMMDFVKNEARDSYLYVDYAKSYYNFVNKFDKSFISDLNSKSIKLLELFSKEINNSKRIEESIILKETILSRGFSVEKLKKLIRDNYEYIISEETIKSCVANINFKFVREKKDGRLIPARDIYNLKILKLENNTFSLESEFQNLIEEQDFKTFLLDSIEYSLSNFNKDYESEKWHNGFLLYRKYSRKDVFRILNFSENPVAQNVGGYLVSPDNKYCPIFVNYHKEDDISESTKYEDEFVNPKEFDWMSKSNRKIESKDVQSILGRNGKIRLPLFIKKNNDEGTEFYYMGDINPQLNNVEQTKMNSDSGKQVSVVKIRFDLENPVSDSMYQYLEENLDSKSKKIVAEKPKESQSIQLKIDIPETTTESIHTIPFYDFYAAAGTFSEMQDEKDYNLIPISERYATQDYFACQIKGESMNRIIPNNSICLFKKYSGGSRSGKILLIENRDSFDPDFNSAFTVKTYSSQKNINENSWEHTSIVLKPNSFEDNYNDIIIDENNSSEMRVIGEFVTVLS